VTQVVEHLPSKDVVLNSIPSFAEKEWNK
jgi:hypothetical protein